MSNSNQIDKRDLASFVEHLKDSDRSEATKQASVNVIYSLWDSLGTVETSPELDDSDADEILAELPMGFGGE